MSMARLLIAGTVVLAFALGATGKQPLGPPSEVPRPNLPIGLWNVTFANEVTQSSVIRQDGTAAVVEMNRNAPGRTEVKDGAVVITYDDDRVERWTPVGRRMVVEHWFPAAQYPAGKPVVGIAERVR